MGWWEERAGNWQMMIVAQMGFAAIAGGGVFFALFRRPGLQAQPLFLLGALGRGIGGSIGSGASVSWSDVIYQLRHPSAQVNYAANMWNDLSGTFSPQDVNWSSGSFQSVGVSAVPVGAQLVEITASPFFAFGPNSFIFRQRINVPRNLRQLAALPSVSGSMGIGVLDFHGIWKYLG
jgi:hypothetical protein